jgi:hypothetical protein
MAKYFVEDEIDQSLLLPPSLHDWLPESHLARFVADLVNSLELSEFYTGYEKHGRDQAPYHPLAVIRPLTCRPQKIHSIRLSLAEVLSLMAV